MTHGCSKLDKRFSKDNDSIVLGSFLHNELGRIGKSPQRGEKTSKAVNSLGKCQRELYPNCK